MRTKEFNDNLYMLVHEGVPDKNLKGYGMKKHYVKHHHFGQIMAENDFVKSSFKKKTTALDWFKVWFCPENCESYIEFFEFVEEKEHKKFIKKLYPDHEYQDGDSIGLMKDCRENDNQDGTLSALGSFVMSKEFFKEMK